MNETRVQKIVSDRLGECYYDVAHKSGLRAFVFPKSFSTFFGVIGVRFGSVDREFLDKKGKHIILPAGTAHFLEHKMFENPDKSNSDEHFAALGADDNAYTTYGTTRYLFSTTENEEKCLSELLRMVTNPYFTKKTVKKEQGIIAREIVMGEDNPWFCGNDNMLRGLYRKSSLRDSICGSVESIGNITDKLLYSAYENFYTPENMALSVCGDITPERVIEILDRELADIKPRPAAKGLFEEEPEGVEKEYVEKRMKVSRPILFLGIKDDIRELDKNSRAKRRAGMSVLNNMLFSSSGEFYNRLLEDKLISPSFSFGYSMVRDCAYTVLSGESDDPQRVAELIREKLEKTAAEGLSAEDFERCRRVAGAGYIRLFDSSEEIADDIMMNSWFSGTDPFSLLEILDCLTLEYLTELLSALCRGEQTLSVIKEKV